MNQDRIVSASIDFRPLSYEQTFAHIEADKENLIDIYLSINGKPLITNDASSGKSLNGIRVYYHYHKGFNPDDREEETEFAVDITPSVIYEIKRMIDLDQAKSRSQYKSALDEWLYTEKKLGVQYPGGDIFEAEMPIARRQKDLQPLSNSLDQLGNQDIGWGGNLHIFNFLYSYIDIPAVALSSVIRHHNQNSDKKIDPASLKKAKITFSSGRCRKFIPYSEWLQADLRLGGTLNVRLEYYYQNPLVGKVIQMEQRTDKLENRASDLEQRCSALEGKISSTDIDVDIQKARVDDLELSLQEIRLYIDPLQESSIQKRLDILDKNISQLAISSARLNEEVNSNNTQVVSLDTKIDTLKESIRQLIGNR